MKPITCIYSNMNDQKMIKIGALIKKMYLKLFPGIMVSFSDKSWKLRSLDNFCNIFVYTVGTRCKIYSNFMIFYVLKIWKNSENSLAFIWLWSWLLKYFNSFVSDIGILGITNVLAALLSQVLAC